MTGPVAGGLDPIEAGDLVENGVSRVTVRIAVQDRELAAFQSTPSFFSDEIATTVCRVYVALQYGTALEKQLCFKPGFSVAYCHVPGRTDVFLRMASVDM